MAFGNSASNNGWPEAGHQRHGRMPRASKQPRSTSVDLGTSDWQAERASHRAAERFPSERIGRCGGCDERCRTAASAVRMMPPTFPGSCTSCATTTRRVCRTASTAVERRSVRRAMPTAPAGVRTGLIDSSVLRDTMNTSAPSASELLGKRPIDGSRARPARTLRSRSVIRICAPRTADADRRAAALVRVRFLGSCERARDSV